MVINILIFIRKVYFFLNNEKGAYPMNGKIMGITCLSIAASLWGGMYIVVKIIVDTVAPIELVWIRFFLAAITLGTISLLTKQSWKIPLKYWKYIVIVGIAGYVISLLFQDTGTLLATSQIASIVTATTPSFMIIFARFLLKEKITTKKIISLLLASSGVLIIVGINTDSSSLLGILSLVMAAVTWAFISVVIKIIPEKYSLLVITTYASIIAVIILLPIVIYRFDSNAIVQLFELKIVLGVLYLGICSTAGGFYLWNKGLQLAGVTTGGLIFFLQPIVGILLGWFILGERVSFNFWIGAGFIFFGVLVSLYSNKKIVY